MCKLIGRDIETVQILGTISADTPTPVWSKDDAAASQEIYMVEVPAELQKRFGKLFALRVIGKGMIDALIDDGDFVIVAPHQPCKQRGYGRCLVQDRRRLYSSEIL